MSEQPTALWLADLLENDPTSKAHHHEAAAKLRLLHEAHDWQYQMAIHFGRRTVQLRQVNEELLAALRMVRDADDDCHKDGLPTIPPAARETINAVIAKAEEENS